MPRHALPLVTSLVLCVAVLAGAQDTPAPDGWKWATDTPAVVSGKPNPGPGEFSFTTMAPGWHVTSRPAAVLYHPTAAVSGRFTVESEVFLFPGASAEGFGIFVGGQDLDGAPRYVAFLVRRDGSAAVARHEGAGRRLLQPWARHTAITPHPGGDATARNVLRVEAEAAQVSLLVNGTKVLDVPRTAGDFDGIVGLRVGADLNLHVTNLDVTRRLAQPSKKETGDRR